MNKVFLKLNAIFLINCLIFSACKKDSNENNNNNNNIAGKPTITLKIGEGYISSNTTLKYNDLATIGISASSNGSDNLAKIKITNNNNSVLDSAFTSVKMIKDFSFTKDISTNQKITFQVTDVAGNSASTTIELNRLNSIKTYNSIVLGAQDTIEIGGFLVAESGTIYNMPNAHNNQDKVNIFCFYEAANGNNISIASPGSSINGVFMGNDSPENWSIKNLTNFDKINTFSVSDFDGCQTDELLINSFSGNYRKAKDLHAGDIVTFKTNTGRFGLIKVLNVKNGLKGYVEFAYKIQS